jgi:hypothetical protein
MWSFYCFQKHDDVLKSSSNKYILVYYIHNSKYVKQSTYIIKFHIPDSGPGFRAWSPLCETFIFYNLNTYFI